MADEGQTNSSGIVFQELLHKFQQARKTEDKQNRIRQVTALCNELIDTIEKATSDDTDDFQSCFELLYEDLINLENVLSTEDSKLFVREIFFMILDLLNKSQVCRFLNNHEDIAILHKKLYERVVNLLVYAVSVAPTHVLFTKDDVITRKYADIFCAMYNRVKSNLSTSIQTQRSTVDDIQTTEFILLFIWNLSDRTIIVPWLLGICFVKTMLECLKIRELPLETINSIISIIHNISRHDDGADEIRKLDGLMTIKDLQTNCMTNFEDYTNLSLSMIIALLSTSEQIRFHNKRMNIILNQLLQTTIDATESENFRDQHAFHVSEPLAVFTKLFVDDHSLDYVLNHAETDPQLTASSTIALFVKLLIKFQDPYSDKHQLGEVTCIALLNILWSISFQDKYKAKLQQDEDLLKIIKTLTVDRGEPAPNQYIPRSMESMVKAANGILHNLDETLDNKEVVIADVQFTSNAIDGKPMIMISYAHDNNSFCDKILDEFGKNRDLFDIWIDRDHCSSNEDLWEKIARGIKESNLVVCLLSEEYFNSKSCRKEASFAIQRKKAIIPVYIGQPGDCDWLDIHIACLKYVRFKGDNVQLESNKVQELLKTVQATIKETSTHPLQEEIKQYTILSHVQTNTETNKSTTFDAGKPPGEWTAADIHKWFENHKVCDMLMKLFDFQSINEINEYAVKLRADPKKEFIKYEQLYAKNHDRDELEEYKFNRFKDALLSLANKHPSTLKSSMASEQSSASKSSVCTIL